MRLRVTLPAIVVLLFTVSLLAAGRSPDPTRARLVVVARLATFTERDFNALSSKAESGDREAQFWVGSIYEQGRLVPRDQETAKSWFLKSANKGYAPAERTVGVLYWYSEPAKAVTWLQRAARKGDSEAQFWLGTGYEQGLFGVTNYRDAVDWLTKSAKQGHPDAEASLGQMYEDGEGVKQNYSMAAKWYRKAAEHVPNLGGAGQGRNDLGLLYLNGLGVLKDYIQAYFWFSLANVELNASDAKAHMTEVEIAKAERMANDWKSHHSLQ
jgi:tetratricopeptide (TPR) repeat protein